MAEIDECVECIFRIDIEGLSDGTTVVFNGRCTGEKIIRCKDCKHYYYADNRIPQEQRYSCDLDGDRWSPDSFCSFAERREE